MDKIKISVKPRGTTKPGQLRRDGLVPATLYGPGQDSESVQVDAKEFGRLPAAAYSHMIELDFGGKTPVNAVIRHVQRKSTANQLLHIEFYRVRLDRKLTMTVPLKFIGTSPAVTEGGVLSENFQDVEVECFPGDIPEFIEVDMSLITEIDGSIHMEDLKISDKIKLLNPPDEVVVKVVAPRAVAEETPAAAATTEAAPAAEPAAS